MPYIGNKYEIGDHNNSWKPLDDISSYVATFDGSATNAVSTTNNTIRVPEHRFIQGQRVTYTNGGGGNIGGLTSGTAYYIIHDTNNEFKLATSLSNANASTAINLSVVGSGTSHTVTAAFDGVNKKFKITYSGGKSSRFTSATQLTVAINNIVQRANDTTTFTDGFGISDNEKIVFNVAPVAADIFWGNILSASLPTFDISDNKLDNFTGDGSTTDFTLSHIPANNESIIVTVNGVVQHPTDKNGTRAYSLDASVLAFTAAPANGDEIQVRHIGFAGATTSAVTGFYGRTGNVTLSSSADDAIVGVITATKFSGPFIGTITGGNDIVAGIITATKIDLNGDIDVDGHTNLDNVSIAGVTTATGNIVANGNIDLAGDIDVDGHTNLDNVSIAGVVTATTFVGNGDFVELDVDGHTNLDNVSIAGVTTVASSLIVDGGTTINDNLVVKSDNKVFSIKNASNAVKFEVDTDNGNTTIAGALSGTTASFSGNVSIGGTLTYEDVTNVDAVGLITARNGLKVLAGGANVVGVVTATGADINGDIDVDGHTNLDNVNIVGVTTTNGNVHIGNGDLTFLNNAHKIHNGSSSGNVTIQGGATYAGGRIVLSGGSGSGTGDIRLYADTTTTPVERLRIQSDGNVGLGTNSVSAGDLATGTTIGLPKLHVDCGHLGNGAYHIARFRAGSDNNNNAAVVTINHSNDRGLAIYGGRSSGDKSWIALRSIDVQGRVSNAIEVIGDEGQGVERISLYTGDSTTTTERLTITSTGLVTQTSTWTNTYAANDTTQCGYQVQNQSNTTNTYAALRLTAGASSPATAQLASIRTGAGANDFTIQLETGNTAFEALRIDSSGRMGLGTNAPDGYDNEAENFVVASSNHTGITIASTGSDKRTNLYFADGTSGNAAYRGAITYDHASDYMMMRTAGAERLRITSAGKAIFTEEIETPQDYPKYRPTLDFNFAAVKKLDSRFTFSRTGPASYVDEDGYVQIVGANVPRFDHDPVTKESKGLLTEQSCANWIKQSTNLSESGWGTNNVTHTLAPDVVAPDGTTGSVYESKENNANSYHASHYSGSIPVTSGQYYTVSTWIKKGPNYRTDINSGRYMLYCSRGTGTVASIQLNPDLTYYTKNVCTDHSVTKYRNGWVRVTYSFTSNASVSSVTPHWLLGNGGSYSGNGASSVYIWGCQFEQMRFPTSYVPTNGSVVFRGTDDVTLDGTEFTDVFNPDEGTSIVHAHMPNENGASGLTGYAFKNSAVSAVHLGLSRDNNGSPVYHYYHDGSNTGFTRGSATGDNMYKGALSFKTSDLDSYVNGSANSNTTTFTMPTIDNLRIGGTSGANYLGGHVARFMYYPVKLTNNQLITLTS